MANIETQYADEFDELRANIPKVATETPNVAAWALEVGKIEREIREREGMPRKSSIPSPIPQIMRSIASIVPTMPNSCIRSSIAIFLIIQLPPLQ